MNTKLLVDAIVQQTTLVIAQVCTASGIRAPLARVADQVFLGLAREIEAQGVRRKVAADMFGLALRSYQKKVQRLTESATLRDRTLWEATLDFLTLQGAASRHAILDRFQQDDEEAVAAVLADLVGSGLAYATGRGPNTLYRLTSAEDRQRLENQELHEAATAMLWLFIYREGPLTKETAQQRMRLPASAFERSLEELLVDGAVCLEESSGLLRSESLTIDVGQRMGWEAAVFDHYQAVCKAIAAKVRLGPQSGRQDTIGGATLSFHVHPGHPMEAKVYGLLRHVRADLNELWEQVRDYNREHSAETEDRARVTFYFGQNIEPVETEPASSKEPGEEAPGREPAAPPRVQEEEPQ